MNFSIIETYNDWNYNEVLIYMLIIILGKIMNY